MPFKFERALLVHSKSGVFESLSGFKVGSVREFSPSCRDKLTVI